MARAEVLSSTVQPRPADFKDGIVLLVLNPKAYVIISLMFAQFSGASGLPILTFVLLISAVFTLNNFIAFTTWTFLGEKLARVFRSPSQARVLNLGLGVLLAGVAVWMLIPAAS